MLDVSCFLRQQRFTVFPTSSQLPGNSWKAFLFKFLWFAFSSLLLSKSIWNSKYHNKVFNWIFSLHEPPASVGVFVQYLPYTYKQHIKLIYVWTKIRGKQKFDKNWDPLFNPKLKLPTISLLPQILITLFILTNTNTIYSHFPISYSLQSPKNVCH